MARQLSAGIRPNTSLMNILGYNFKTTQIYPIIKPINLQPIAESSDELKEEDSVLKIQHRIDGQNIFKGSGPDLEEVQMLTHTPKHNWIYKYDCLLIINDWPDNCNAN